MNADVTYESEKATIFSPLKEDLRSVLRPHLDGCKRLISQDFRDVLPLGMPPLVLGSGHTMPRCAGDGGDMGLLS